MENLNEQKKRILKLMNFSFDDHTHDNLSENFINEQKIKKSGKTEIKIKRGKQRFVGKSGDSDEVDYEDQDWSDNPENRKELNIKRFKNNPWKISSEKMMSHMSEASKKNWQKLITDPDNVEYAVEALKVYSSDYSKLKGIQAKKLVIIVGNDKQTEFEIIEPEEQEIPDIVVPIQLPVNEDPSNLFENCKYSPNGNFVGEVDELVSIISKQKEQMKDPRVFCSYINIESSASRYRNVCGSDKTLSWSKLSKLRNDAALKYLKERLISAGVMVDNETKIVQDYSGKNGDGSSGPNPPKGLRFNTDGTAAWSCGDSSAEGQKCKGKRNDFGAPSSNESDYDEYRYVIMDLGLIFKGQGTPDPDNEKPDPEVKEIKTELYDITFYVPPVGLSFWLPKITMKFPKFRWIKRRKKNTKRKKPFQTLKCPKW